MRVAVCVCVCVCELLDTKTCTTSLRLRNLTDFCGRLLATTEPVTQQASCLNPIGFDLRISMTFWMSLMRGILVQAWDDDIDDECFPCGVEVRYSQGPRGEAPGSLLRLRVAPLAVSRCIGIAPELVSTAAVVQSTWRVWNIWFWNRIALYTSLQNTQRVLSVRPTQIRVVVLVELALWLVFAMCLRDFILHWDSSGFICK